uniref:Uncharacterized protein n=1 Tax=Oryza sativa subsp. japonica TaxID=39947 RepID=Q69T69_ORYSJ|nr:hypothetical protein [Oryza sativa Japonica Group]BAD35883.1 hypothetical protein [Oryza sativa Japonica Group]
MKRSPFIRSRPYIPPHLGPTNRPTGPKTNKTLVPIPRSASPHAFCRPSPNPPRLHSSPPTGDGASRARRSAAPAAGSARRQNRHQPHLPGPWSLGLLLRRRRGLRRRRRLLGDGRR